MMQRQSPPKHRHDGTSPLPLGMDWSPPPRVWAGRETVWPHDPRTGWSYCVTIPSWNVLAKSRDSDPTVFYRVQVGLQSPEGITTTRTVLRRFNDFLKLQAALKRLFPQKNHPPAPPKGLLRMKTRAMLEERRSTLEEWMSKLLSDIDVSRSVVVASFLELEAAARSSFQEDGQPSQDPLVSANSSGSSLNFHPTSSVPLPDGSPSLMSDYGSDVAYETSEIGTTSSLGRDNSSEIGLEDPYLEDDLSSPIDKFVKYGMSNIDEGLSMGHAILEQLESFPKHKMHARDFHTNLEHSTSNGSSSKASPHATDMVQHVRKLSNESIGSDRSSQRGNELSNSAYSHSNGYGNLDLRTVEGSDYQISDNVKLVVPLDQRQKMNRLLTTMQRRLITAKTDMEDLMSRLNQEVAVKDYLATKVKDLEVELETTKQKSKENLEQAILIERERVTQMQWDMEELRRKSMEMELKLNSQQAQSTSEFTNSPTNQEKHVLQHHELDSVKKQFEDLSKRYQQLEVKSKAEIKVLVKEVKSLRSSQGELKQHLNQSLEEKSKTEELLQEERKRNAQTRISLRKLLSRCKSIHDELQECNVTHLLQEQGDGLPVNIPSSSNLLELVATSDNEIGLLLAEVHHLDQAVDSASTTTDPVAGSDDDLSLDEELKQMLTSILVDSWVLRKQVNALIVRALEKNKSLEKKVDTKPGSNVNEPSEI